jgi:hypothetical protein
MFLMSAENPASTGTPGETAGASPQRAAIEINAVGKSFSGGRRRIRGGSRPALVEST